MASKRGKSRRYSGDGGAVWSPIKPHIYKIDGEWIVRGGLSQPDSVYLGAREFAARKNAEG